jgi:hypothetical protein
MAETTPDQEPAVVDLPGNTKECMLMAICYMHIAISVLPHRKARSTVISALAAAENTPQVRLLASGPSLASPISLQQIPL